MLFLSFLSFPLELLLKNWPVVISRAVREEPALKPSRANVAGQRNAG